jgi:hypothetical protein
VLSAGTVDSVSVIGEVVGSFSINARYAGLVAAVWDRVLSAALHNIPNSAGRRLRQLGAGDITIHSGTAQAGSTATTIKLDTAAIATNDIYNGATVVLTGGTGVGQTRRIVDYVGSTRVASLDRAWVTTPDATSTFDLIVASRGLISDEGTAQAGAATTLTLAATASANNDVYNGSLVTITGGTGAGQTREALDYNGTTKVLLISTGATDWSVTPDSTSLYAVIPSVAMSSDAVVTLTAGEVNAEVVDALATDTYAEATGVPGYPAALTTMVQRLYAVVINGLTVTATKKQYLNAAGTAQFEKDLSDNGTTYSENAGNAP